MKEGRHLSRISSFSYKAFSQDSWKEPGQEGPSDDSMHWRENPLLKFVALPALAAIILFGLIFWHYGHNRAAIAAERVLEPDRIMTIASAPKPLDPLLEEGEGMRYPSHYRDRTEKREVTGDEVYRGLLFLVNFSHPLPEGYLPEDLAITNEMLEALAPSGFSVTKTGLALNREATEKLRAMISSAWEEEGLGGFLLQSGYRDFAYQGYLHQRKVEEYKNAGYGEAEARKAAAFWVARPGESEHHTGLAVDMTSRSHPDLKLTYGNTAHGAWLRENSWRFGYIVRYPEDKTELTQIGYEPWHIRYVGRPHSDLLKEKGWCLEEYLEFLIREGGYTYRDGEGAVWQIDRQPIGDGAIDVPLDMPYTLSGDGDGGFIITVLLEE